jgi:hypothetical protein
MARAVHPITAIETVAAVEPCRCAVDVGSNTDRTTPWCRRQVCFAVMELSPIKLVALLKRGNLMRLRRQWYSLEVWMLHRIESIDPRLPIQLEEFSH